MRHGVCHHISLCVRDYTVSKALHTAVPVPPNLSLVHDSEYPVRGTSMVRTFGYGPEDAEHELLGKLPLVSSTTLLINLGHFGRSGSIGAKGGIGATARPRATGQVRHLPYIGSRQANPGATESHRCRAVPCFYKALKATYTARQRRLAA